MTSTPPICRLLSAVGLVLALAGCGTTTTCKMDNMDYVQARERPRLQMPEGVSGSERLGGSVLVIPPAAPNPDKLDPAPRCLDEPPAYSRRSATLHPAGDAPGKKTEQ